MIIMVIEFQEEEQLPVDDHCLLSCFESLSTTCSTTLQVPLPPIHITNHKVNLPTIHITTLQVPLPLVRFPNHYFWYSQFSWGT